MASAASPDRAHKKISVRGCSYAYQGATAAASDHGIVTAKLHLRH